MMPSRPLADADALGDRVANRAWAILLRIAVRLGEWAGIERTLGLGRGVGRLWHRLHGPRTARVQRQLARAFPEQDSEALQRMEARVFAHLGEGIAELILMLGHHRREVLTSVKVVGLEHLETARSEGTRGAVVIAPHLGNWELAAAKLADLGVPVSAVYRGLKQPALQRALLEARGGFAAPLGSKAGADSAIEQIPMGPRAGVQFIRALEAGRNVLVLLDQHARRDEGRVVDFFGQPARTRFGPLKLADRIGAPVLLASARRSTEGRSHTVTLRPALGLTPGASRDDEILLRNLQRVTAELEKEIRTAPDQWIWTHRRWRAGND